MGIDSGGRGEREAEAVEVNDGADCVSVSAETVVGGGKKSRFDLFRRLQGRGEEEEEVEEEEEKAIESPSVDRTT
ncbi:hypothetical protein FOPE_08409 [Fonsecaea pedrosoi]|nr:hypothetical protein FOPE_08409 [Fonsecaea pedrosoi]